MAELPTNPGRGAGQVRNAIDDTLRAEPSVDPADPGGPARPLPAQDRYRLGAELGRGGMGRVVEAFDLQLGRTVALKEVLPKGGPGVARRFKREVQLTARLEHPSIIPLYDSGSTADGRPFYVMRRVSGLPLDQLMTQAADLDERLTHLPALLAAIDAVAHAHRRGVIHRDLKPANILVGELGEIVVIDWGLAKVIGEDGDRPGTVIAASTESLRTQMGSVFGTPGFMSPEQARGEELGPRGDVYALGAILYQLLAGAPPHSGTSATEVIVNTGSRAVTPVNVVAPGAPRDLVAIVGKAIYEHHFTVAEALSVVEGMGWSMTNSWARGAYSTSRPSKRLLTLLEPFRMTPEYWWAKVVGIQTSGHENTSGERDEDS
jgi:serine/threonine protein kinase